MATKYPQYQAPSSSNLDSAENERRTSGDNSIDLRLLGNEHNRLETFSSWPLETPVPPRDLAKSGFYYTGFGDNVRCFFCDGGLGNWEAGDEPWIEHTRWFPECPYVRNVKGEAYIVAIQERFNNPAQAASPPASGEDKFKALENSDTLMHFDSLPETDLEMDTLPVSAHEENQENEVNPTPELEELGAFACDPTHPLQTVVAQKLIDKGHRPRDILMAMQTIIDTNATARIDSLTENDVLNALKQIKDSDSIQGAVGGCKQEAGKKFECKVCFVMPVCIVFLPCSHLVCCALCAPAMNICPVCRGKIKGTVKAKY